VGLFYNAPKPTSNKHECVHACLCVEKTCSRVSIMENVTADVVSADVDTVNKLSECRLRDETVEPSSGELSDVSHVQSVTDRPHNTLNTVPVNAGVGPEADDGEMQLMRDELGDVVTDNTVPVNTGVGPEADDGEMRLMRDESVDVVTEDTSSQDIVGELLSLTLPLCH